MRRSDRVGVGLGILTTLGCAAMLFQATGCSGNGADDAGVAEDGVTQADPSAPVGDAPPPAPPGSPLPEELQVDAGSSETQAPAPAPVDPGFRTMWVTGLAADRATGAAKAIGAKAFTPVLGGGMYGFDVNPVADKIRVHSDTDQNLRLDSTTGTAVVDGTLAFAPGDKNEGQSPNLIATAYTNSVSPAPTATTLYALDSTRNLLTKLATPNDGKVTTVGALGVDPSDVAGFDIWGGASGGAGGAVRPLQAYAALRVAGKTGLYEIDLDKGSAKLVGEIGTKARLRGLAIEP